MRQLYIFLLAFILSILGSMSLHAKDLDNDGKTNMIVYKAIIYFYPDTVPPTQTTLSKKLPNFTHIETAPKKVDKPYSSIELMDNFADFYPAPDLEYLRYAGRGLSKTQAENIQSAKHILVLDVIYPQSKSLKNYKTVNEFLHETATKHSGLIWDSETRELFTPTVWKEKRLSSYKGKFPDIVNHITIHAYNNEMGDGIRAITLGMAKFGLPDVVINNFSWSLSEPMGNLINLVSQSLLEGMTPDESKTLTLNINKLKNKTHKERLRESLKDNAVTELKLNYGQATVEEGDPDNFLLEILFDLAEGNNLSEKQDKTVSSLFGWEDTIASVRHDDTILAASQRAKNKLNSLRKDFQSGLEPGEFILLKAPFETDTGGNEWMWVEVLSWNGKTIKGLLKNEPYHVPGLRAGSEVTINQEDVFDYIRNFSNGTSEGNETGTLMQKYR